MTQHCLNCGAAAENNFCSVCGQETRLHVPSVREFVHEFVGHYVAVEGRLWKSLKLLLFKPGMLTTEYMAGRRQRYVVPLRLFLTMSVIFFAVLKFSGNAQPEFVKDAPAPQAEASAHKPGVKVDKDVLENDIRKRFPKAAAKIDDFDKASDEEKQRVIKEGFFNYGPYALILLMPVFALILKVLYLGSGRRYGEHLLFALHTNTFAYLALALAVASPWGLPRAIMLGWLVAYLPLAMRRMYGGNFIAMLARWTVLIFLHSVMVGLAIVGALLYAVIH